MAESTQFYIDSLYKRLKESQKAGRLPAEGTGLQMLKAIENGSLAPAEVGLILQGASLSSSDELMGFTRSLLGNDSSMIADTVNKGFPDANVSSSDVGIALERGTINQYREENQGKALALEAAGGLALGPLGAGRTALARGAEAVGTGLVSGFMADEGNAIDRADGAAIGGSLGGVSQLVIDQFGKRLVSPVYRALFNSSKKASDREGVNLARQTLIQQIEADGMSVDEAVAFIGQQAGKQVTLADLGSNTQALIDVLSVMPGPGKLTANRFLQERMKGRNARLGTILQDAFGQRANFYNDFQAMKAARKSTADKLYGAANKLDVPFTPELQELMRTPAMQQAYQNAVRIAGNQKDPVAMRLRITPQGRIVDADGAPVSAINTRFLHYMKQGLDDVAFPKIPSEGVGATEVNAVRDLRSEFLEMLDDANPMYARARNLYAGDSSVMEAMKRGRGLLSEDGDELAADLMRMDKSEKEAFRLGALQNLQDQFNNSVESANIARNVMKTETRRRLMRLAFPSGKDGDQAFDVFMDNLGRESNMAVTERAGANSLTAQRSELMRQFRNQAEGATPPTSAIDLIMSSLRESNQTQTDQKLRAASAEIARVLTETDPAILPKILSDLGRGTMLQSIQRNAPSILPQILPLLGQGLTGPGNVGSMSGRFGAEIAPANLNSAQQGLMMQ
jgi:hypothetical protein